MSEGELFTVEDGELLIRFARENIKNFLTTGKRLPVPPELKEKFGEKYGAFVTLNRADDAGNPLRGCIGYIEPKFPLYDVIHKVSISSAIEDPRFPSVSLEELEHLVIEVSILTPPKLLKVEDPEEYLDMIKIGRDGLIAERGMSRGLLLPQVPVDHGRNWDVKTFLKHTCTKAWLPQDAWKDTHKTKIYAFRAILFEEEEPNGPVKRKYLS